MTLYHIVDYRLINQQITRSACNRPGGLVRWMGAMQAQDFGMAKWAIGLRLPKSDNNSVEEAFNKGEILRTHLLRPTWHFVAPADIRWILALTAPRVNAASAFMYRKLELDDKLFNRSNDVIVKALQGGKYLTRAALQLALEKAKISAVSLRLSYLMMRAELDGIICSGPREGNQFTYALLEERVKPVENLQRDEARATLVNRYFSSRDRQPCRILYGGRALPPGRQTKPWRGLTGAFAARPSAVTITCLRMYHMTRKSAGNGASCCRITMNTAFRTRTGALFSVICQLRATGGKIRCSIM